MCGFFYCSKHKLSKLQFINQFMPSCLSLFYPDSTAICPDTENLSPAAYLVSVGLPKVSLSLSLVLPLPCAPFVVLLPFHTLCEVELMFDCGRLVDGKCSHSLCMTSMLLLISRSQPSRGNDFVHYVCLMKLSH